MIAVRKEALTGDATYLVECKWYSEEHRVGVGVVRSLFGVVMDEGATKGIVATTSFFTRGAEAFEEKNANRLSLSDYNRVLEWLDRIALLGSEPA
jgi:restriction system protein